MVDRPGSRSIRRVAPAVVACGLIFAGCGGPPSLQRARTAIAQGRIGEGCTIAGRVARRAASRGLRLDGLRLWIDCLARSGELERAEQWLREKSAEAPALLYGRALVDLARSPAALPRALTLLQRAARRWPDEPELPYRLGVVLLADNQPAAARPWLQRAHRLRPDAVTTVALAHVAVDQGRLDQALERLRELVELRPAADEIARGRLLVRRIARRRWPLPPAIRSRYRQALDELTKHDRASAALTQVTALLGEQPELPALHLLSGIAQLRLGNLTEGVAALRRAAELDPDDPVVLRYLAATHAASGQLRRSVELYRRALQRDPLSAEAVLGLGQALRQLEQPASAARAFDRLVTLTGDHRSLRLSGRAHLAAGQLQRAQRRFDRLLALEPGDYEGNFRLAEIYWRRAQKEPQRREVLIARARRHAAVAARTQPHNAALRELSKRLSDEP